MLRLADLNRAWSEVARVWRETIKCGAVKVENHRSPQPEGPTCPHYVFDKIMYAVELRDRIFGFATRYFIRIREECGVFSLTMPIVAQSGYARRLLSAASSTISRVTRSFSM